MRKYIDWTDWAGDNAQEAEAEIQAAEERRAARNAIAPLLRYINEGICEHEFHVGVCLICEAEDEYFEPSDAQIPGTYDVRKGVA